MDYAEYLFAVLAVGGVAWHVITTLLIFEYLRRHGQQVSLIWLRLMALRYASQYRDISKQETGKVGSLFYHWVVSINLALVFVILAFVLYRF